MRKGEGTQPFYICTSREPHPPARRSLHLAQVHGCPVTELSSERSELMTAVRVRMGLRAGHELVPCGLVRTRCERWGAWGVRHVDKVRERIFLCSNTSSLKIKPMRAEIARLTYYMSFRGTYLRLFLFEGDKHCADKSMKKQTPAETEAAPVSSRATAVTNQLHLVHA